MLLSENKLMTCCTHWAKVYIFWTQFEVNPEKKNMKQEKKKAIQTTIFE